MTYHDQLRSTFRLGSGVLLGSALLLVVMYAARSTGYTRLSDVIFVAALIALGIAVLTLVAGLIGRSAHRWVWFNIVSRSTLKIIGRTASQRLLESPASPVLRLWLHLDDHGKDRDDLV